MRLDVVKACGEIIGYERVGIRLSPGAYLNQIVGDPRDAAVFQSLLSSLNQYPIAYVHVGNFDDTKTFAELNQMTMSKFIRSHYRNTLIGCGSYTAETAVKSILNKAFDLIAFGRPFIANPNLIEILRNQGELQPYDNRMLDILF